MYKYIKNLTGINKTIYLIIFSSCKIILLSQTLMYLYNELFHYHLSFTNLFVTTDLIYL